MCPLVHVGLASHAYLCHLYELVGADARRNSLEALVWEKEAEVDRFRDRWPMSMLVSRAKMFNLAEENKPRDVMAALHNGKGKGGVAVLAEVRWRRPRWCASCVHGCLRTLNIARGYHAAKTPFDSINQGA